MKKMQRWLCWGMVAVGLPAGVYAQGEDGFSLGIGVGYGDSIYQGVDGEALVMPMIQYQSGGLYFKGLEAGYRVVDSGLLEVAVMLQGRMDGYEEDDSDFLAGMEDRKKSLDGGVRLSANVARARISFSWQHDLLDEHKGHESTLRVAVPFPVGQTIITPFVGASYLSDALADYYYGVRPEEATSVRPAYETDAAVKTFAGVSLMYAYDSNWKGMVSFNAEGYADEIADSPIVEDDSRYSVMGGVLYSF